jgi:hypothetical protein
VTWLEVLAIIVGCILACLIGAALMDFALRAKHKSGHNDRDYYCKFWWGDRGGYNYQLERCYICRPKGAHLP